MSESPPRQPLRILVVDDHILFRRGICQVMADISDMEVVAEAADGEQAVREVERLRPHGLDLVLMDVEMPKLDGMAATRRIAAVDPDLPVVMLTVSGLDQDVLAAIQAGAVGFLSKSLSAPALIRTLRDFHRERALPMSRTMATRVLTQLRSPAAESARGASTSQASDPLTQRELEVLDLIAQGARDRDIADSLTVTENTVKKHVKSILQKLGARNRTEAAARHRQPRF